MAKQSIRAAVDAKCRDCCAGDAGAHWRLHTAACTVTVCPLWQVRPRPKYAPAWIASRDADDLPTGWTRLPTEAAIAAIKAIGGTETVPPGKAALSDGHGHAGRVLRAGGTETAA